MKNLIKKIASEFPNPFEIINRMWCVAMYGCPFLELYLFFNPLMRSYRISPAWLESMAIYYRQIPGLNLVIFIIIIYLLSYSRIKLSYYSRYNYVQVLIILFLANFLETVEFLFPYAARGHGTITAPFFFFLCFGQMLLICYCVIYAILGKIPNIPLLTRAVKIQLGDAKEG